MDVNSPAFIDNPYRFYRRRREMSPVLRSGPHTWTLTGYGSLAAALAHPAAGRGNVGQTPRPDGDTTHLAEVRRHNPALQVLENWMLFQNPPEHTRVRGLVARAFTVKMIEGLEPRIRAVADDLIDRVREGSPDNTFDFVPAISYPFPETVIAEMIGIPPADRHRFRAWTRDFAVAVQSDFHLLAAPIRERLNQSATDLTCYFEDLVGTRALEDHDDLISRLISGGRGEDGLNDAEILANCVFLLFAGHETTTSLISNGLHALLSNREQFDRLRADPAMIPRAVEECLRYDPPVQMVGRYALDDIAVGGHRIQRGHHIYAFLGAAGRDPDVNPEPDRFDVSREPVKHLAFARGAHHCLGASLARLEMKVMLEELVERLPNLEPAGPGIRRKTWLMRGFDSLPMQF